jgi:transcriptional regulator with XRE-family HTH domain
MPNFFETISAYRHNDESVAAFARRCGVQHTTLIQWSRGQVPKIKTIYLVAHNLGVDPTPWFAAMGSPTPD